MCGGIVLYPYLSGVESGPCSTYRRHVPTGECQQFVPVIFVLFLDCRNLGGQTMREVVDQCLEAVKDGHDFLLKFKWRNRDNIFSKAITIYSRHFSSGHIHAFILKKSISLKRVRYIFGILIVSKNIGVATDSYFTFS